MGVALLSEDVGCTRGVLSTVAKGRTCFVSIIGRLMLNASAEAAGLETRDSMVGSIEKSKFGRLFRSCFSSPKPSTNGLDTPYRQQRILCRNCLSTIPEI